MADHQRQEENKGVAEASPSPPSSSWCNQRNAIRALVLVLVIVLIVLAFTVFKAQNRLIDLVQWFHEHRLPGSFAMVGAYAVCTVLFVPGSILTLGAGFAFGLGIGFAVVIVGASIGLLLSFLLGRYVFRQWVQDRLISRNPKFAAIDKAIALQGAKIVFLLRLAPIVPFNFLNYALSITSIPFPQYALTSCFGIAPGTLMYVYFGSLVSDLTEISSGAAGPSPGLKIAILVISGVIIIGVVVFITIIARRAINQAIADAEQTLMGPPLQSSPSLPVSS